MATANASFQLQVNSGGYQAAGTPVVAAVGDTIDARIVSVAGINGNAIAWTIFGTHGEAAPSITESGTPDGQIASFTVPALTLDGGAFGLRCDVNGGADAGGSSLLTAKSAIYVLNSSGLRPFFINESLENDSVYGVVPRLNQALGGAVPLDGNGPSATPARFETTVTAPSSADVVYTYTPTITNGLLRISVFAGASDVADAGAGRMGFHRAAWYTIASGTPTERYDTVTESVDPNAEGWTIDWAINSGDIEIQATLDGTNDTKISGHVYAQEFAD